jgi:hypothetical protein
MEEYRGAKLGIRGLPEGMSSIIVRQTLVDKFTELGIETGQIVVTVNHTPDSKEIGTTGYAFVIVGANDAQKAIDALNKTELFEGYPIDIAVAKPYAIPPEVELHNSEEGPRGESDLR